MLHKKYISIFFSVKNAIKLKKGIPKFLNKFRYVYYFIQQDMKQIFYTKTSIKHQISHIVAIRKKND